MPDFSSVPASSSSNFSEFKSILDAAGTMIVATDADGVVRTFNPAAERLLGWRADEVVGKQTPAIWHVPEEVAARAAELSRKLGRTVQPGQDFFRTSCLEGDGRPSEWTLVRKDGSRFPVQLSVVALHDSAGRVTGFVGTAQDLTDHVRAEEERDRLFNLSLDLLCIANTDGYFIRINPAFSRTLGWSEAELLARPYLDFVHPDDRKATVHVAEELVVSGQPLLQFENRYQHRDGSWRVFSWRAVPQPDGRIYATARDVTEAKQAEEALRLSEQNLAITLNSIGDGVIATDAARRVTRMNPIAEQMTGWTQSEAAGRLIDEVFLIINEETRRPAVIPVNEVLATGIIQGLSNHTVLISRDGTEWTIADSAAPIFGDDGEINGVVLVFRDVAEERRFERSLQLLNADLESRVEQRTTQLAESESFNRATLDALLAHVAVLDETGKIVATNQAWRKFAQANNSACQMVAEGTNYLAICDRAAAAGDPDAAAAARAIRQVLAGEQEAWLHEYPCHSAEEQRWFYCRVTRFSGEGAMRVVVAHENITAMKLAQEQLATARARFETLDRVSPVAIMFFDSDGKCLEVNHRWTEMSGISRQAAVGDNWSSAVHPEDRPRVVRKWSEAVRDGVPIQFDFRVLRPNGEVLWVGTQGIPIRDAEGRVSGFIRVTTDITEQKQTEQALRLLSADLARLRGAAFFEAAVSHLAKLVNCEMAFICRRDPAQPDQLFTLAIIADGTIQSNFSYSVVGTPCEHVVDRRSCVIPSGVKQKYPQDVFLIDHQIESYVGVPFIDGQGRQVGHIGVMSRQPLARPENVEAVAKLFAISVVAEMERQVSERRFTDLFEFSPDAIVITNSDGLIVQANRQVAAVFGWMPEELVGQPVEVLMPANLRAGHSQLRERYLESALPRAMGSGRNDLLGLRKDGSVFPVDISLSPMQTPEGLLVAAAVRDVTERQKVLKELQTVNAVIEQERAQLADRVAERTTELTVANEELIQANRAKSDFLASMSHELRTPLNGILGMNELLLNTELTERQRQFVQAGSTSGKALLQQINDILDLSKIEAGKLELDLHECHLEVIVFDVVDVFVHSAQQKGFPLHCHFDPAACLKVLCDDNRIRQILVNLLGNALKFTKTGEVTLRAECKNWLDDELTLRFSVTDTGRGIPEDRRNRLFAPFSQVDNSTAREFGGTGLGLSICKQLVEMMGGTIGVESQLGVGSTFWFELTLEVVAEDSVVGKRRHMVVGKRVLVIDGADNDRLQIMDCLQAWGCRTELVADVRNALEAVALAESTGAPFASVLADCQLVAGDEYVLLQKLAKPPSPPVIGVGLAPDDETIAYLHQLGIRHVLRTPVRPSTLFNALTSVLAIKSPITLSNQKPDAAANELRNKFSGHILVAEDNSINQMFVRELLKNCGCTCDIAHNGDEALTALQQKRYDLALMDCQMPEMDGFTACREIRRREMAGELSGHLPIIALTANALKGDRERCLKAGMDDYLTKPLQAAQLQAMLARYLPADSAKPTT